MTLGRLLLGAGLLLWGLDAFAQATPRQVRISYSTPNPQTTMGITWNTDSAAVQFVEFGINAVDENQVAATLTDIGVGGLGKVNSVRLSGLTPNTTYRYRVGSDDDGWAPQSSYFEFKTAPVDGCSSFRFVGLGDVRGDAYLDFMENSASEWVSVFDALMGDNPAFAFIAGDLVDDGHEADQWHDFFNQGLNHYTELPVMPAFGNHDDGLNPAGDRELYEELYTLPQQPDGRERYHHFVYGNVLLIGFNSDENGLFQEQADWMEQVLIDNPTTWKIVYFHHPIWTTTPGELPEPIGCSVYCGHPSNEKGQNAYLVDLIDRYDIDVVLQSHNHFYERSDPLRGGGTHESMVQMANHFRGTTNGVRNNEGVVEDWGSLYLVTGGGGAPMIPLTELSNFQVRAPGSVIIDDNYHYMRFTVEDLEMKIEMVRSEDRSVFDSVTITKQEQYRQGVACPEIPSTSTSTSTDTDTDTPTETNDPSNPTTATSPPSTNTGTTAPPPTDTDTGVTDESAAGCECSGVTGGAAPLLLLLWLARRRSRKLRR